MLSIAEYSKSRRVSQTAVRRQLKTYAAELEGHIIETVKCKMLDDEAVSILDSHRMPREIIIEQAESEMKKELDDLRARLDLMKDRAQDLQSQVMKLQDHIIALQNEKTDLLVDQTEKRLLIESKDKEAADLHERIESMDQENRSLQSRLDEAEREANSYIKTWYGRYKKIK